MPPNTKLVSFDVVNLYTNISHELGIEAINSWLSKYPELIHDRFTKEFILESTKLILENNTCNFYFNETMYTQVRGTAIGTKFAPTYSTLVLAYLGEKLFSEVEIQFGKEFAIYIKENWKRFLDDCFIFWTKGEGDLENFHSILNNLHPNLTFTLNRVMKNFRFLMYYF